MGPGYEHDGYVLPYAPFVAPSLKTMPAVEEAFTELGLTATRPARAAAPRARAAAGAAAPPGGPARRRRPPHAPSSRASSATRARRLLGALAAAAAQHEPTDAFFKDGPPLPPGRLLRGLGPQEAASGQHPGLETHAPAGRRTPPR